MEAFLRTMEQMAAMKADPANPNSGTVGELAASAFFKSDYVKAAFRLDFEKNEVDWQIMDKKGCIINTEYIESHHLTLNQLIAEIEQSSSWTLIDPAVNNREQFQKDIEGYDRFEAALAKHSLGEKDRRSWKVGERADYTEFTKRFASLIKFSPTYAAKLFQYLKKHLVSIGDIETEFLTLHLLNAYAVIGIDPRIHAMGKMGMLPSLEIVLPGGITADELGETATDTKDKTDQWNVNTITRLKSLACYLTLADALTYASSSQGASSLFAQALADATGAGKLGTIAKMLDWGNTKDAHDEQGRLSFGYQLLVSGLMGTQARFDDSGSSQSELISASEAVDDVLAAARSEEFLRGEYKEVNVDVVKGLIDVYESFFGHERFFDGVFEGLQLLWLRHMKAGGESIVPDASNFVTAAKQHMGKEGEYGYKGYKGREFRDPDVQGFIKLLDWQLPIIENGQVVLKSVGNLLMDYFDADPSNTETFQATVMQDFKDEHFASSDWAGGDKAMTKVLKRVDEHMRSPIFQKLAVICPILLDQGSREILRSALFKWARTGTDGHQQVVDARWTKTMGQEILRVAWQTRKALGAGLSGSVSDAITAAPGTCDGTAAGVLGSVLTMKRQNGDKTDPITMSHKEFRGQTPAQLGTIALIPQDFGNAQDWASVQWSDVVAWMENYQRVSDPASAWYGFPGYFGIKGGGQFTLEPTVDADGNKLLLPKWNPKVDPGTGHPAIVSQAVNGKDEYVVNPAWLDEAGKFHILVFQADVMNPVTGTRGVWTDIRETGASPNIPFTDASVIISAEEHRALDIAFPDVSKTAEAYVKENSIKQKISLLGYSGALNFANVFNRMGAAMAKVQATLFYNTDPKYRMGSFSAVSAAILEGHEKLRTYEMDIHLASDSIKDMLGNPAHPNEFLHDRHGWTVELKLRRYEVVPPVMVEWDVDSGFTVSVPASNQLRRAGVHAIPLAREALQDGSSYRKAYENALKELVVLLQQVFIDHPVMGILADEREVTIDTSRRAGDTIQNTRFVQQYVSEVKAGRITQMALPNVNAAGTQAEFDFRVGDLLPVGYRFRAKVTFDAATTSGEGKTELWVVDPTGQELSYNPNNPNSGPTIPADELAPGSEIYQLQKTQRDLAKFTTLMPARISENPGARTLVYAEHWASDKDGNAKSFHKWVLRARVELDAGLAGGKMQYDVDVALASGAGTLGRRPAYITYKGTPTAPIGATYAIQEDLKTTTKDRIFILPTVLTYFSRIGAFHAELADVKYHKLIGGVLRRPTFIPPAVLGKYYDPHDGFSLVMPNENLGRTTCEMVIQKCAYDPLEPRLGSRGIIQAQGFILDPVQGIMLVDGKASSYLLLDGFKGFARMTEEAGELVKACGGLRTTLGNPIPSSGIEFLGITSGSQLEGHLHFSAMVSVKPGLATLLDASAGLPMAGHDASELGIVIGDNQDISKAADIMLRDGISDGEGRYSRAGAIGWTPRDENGVWKGSPSQRGRNMETVIETLESRLKDQEILVEVGDGNMIDPDHVAIRPETGRDNDICFGFTQVMPTFQPGLAGTQVAMDLRLYVRDGRLGEWSSWSIVFINPSAVTPISTTAFYQTVDSAYFEPISRVFNVLTSAGMVVKDIHASIDKFDVGKQEAIQFGMTIEIDGVQVNRVVKIDMRFDESSKRWRVTAVGWGINGNTIHRIDWPGIYHGRIPGDLSSVPADRHNADALVGRFPVPGGTTEWLQFVCLGYDPITGAIVYPRAGEVGLYGWLEVIGPAGVGPIRLDTIIDGIPAHPYTLAVHYQAGVITAEQHEIGRLRLLRWMLEFAALLNVWSYDSVPMGLPPIVPDSQHPGDDAYPAAHPDWWDFDLGDLD
jgi:hypothetical protein